MPRGAPDYDIYQRPAIAVPVVWEDDFEAPVLKWTPSSSAGSPDPVLSTTEQWKGVQSVYYATIAAAAERSSLFKRFPLLSRGRAGIEFFIRLNSRTPGYFQAYWSIYDGTNITRIELRLDGQARTASIVTPAGVQVIAANCFPTIPNYTFIPIKLVVDMNTDLYTRLIAGPDQYDISGHALLDAGPTTNRYMALYLRLYGDAVLVMSAYLDNFILSQNEP